MKYSELKAKSAAELQALLLVKYKDQFSLRLKHKTDQLKTTHQIRQVRKDIAQINTALRATQLAQ